MKDSVKNSISLDKGFKVITILNALLNFRDVFQIIGIRECPIPWYQQKIYILYLNINVNTPK